MNAAWSWTACAPPRSIKLSSAQFTQCHAAKATGQGRRPPWAKAGGGGGSPSRQNLTHIDLVPIKPRPFLLLPLNLQNFPFGCEMFSVPLCLFIIRQNVWGCAEMTSTDHLKVARLLVIMRATPKTTECGCMHYQITLKVCQYRLLVNQICCVV